MLKHVLVPLDGSALSEQALENAQEIVAANGKITLVSVIEMPVEYDYALVDIPMTAVAARQFTEEEYNTTYRRVHDYLSNFVKRLTLKGYSVECVIESGDPATVINDVADKNNVDAIVITTHGRTGLTRWLFGSVTQKVITHMTCPILVVQGTVPQKIEEPISSNDEVLATS